MIAIADLPGAVDRAKIVGSRWIWAVLLVPNKAWLWGHPPGFDGIDRMVVHLGDQDAR